ncbi:MAG: hypothetical protein ACRD51_05855, partial [Candidatus Acidiferrum sp.]
YEGDDPPKPRKLTNEEDQSLWGRTKKEAAELSQMRRYLAKLDSKQRTLLLGFAARLARYASK